MAPTSFCCKQISNFLASELKDSFLHWSCVAFLGLRGTSSVQGLVKATMLKVFPDNAQKTMWCQGSYPDFLHIKLVLQPFKSLLALMLFGSEGACAASHQCTDLEVLQPTTGMAPHFLLSINLKFVSEILSIIFNQLNVLKKISYCFN